VKIPRLFPELPLLWRELTELSARRRTYVVRSVGAMIILSLVLLLLEMSVAAELTRASAEQLQLALIGIGGRLFPQIVLLLFIAVDLIMPALTCGAITIEKERNTLGTLFVTRLNPWNIVLEKLGSRLIPMLTLLLLTFPILAFVYSLGGVSTEDLFSAVWLLLWECLLFASIGLLCSAWYSTTVAAFVAAYVLSGFVVFLTLLMGVPLPIPSHQWIDRRVAMMPEESGFLQDLLDNLNVGPLATVVLETVPVMLVAAFFLFLTRMLLFRRAFVGHSSLMLRVFRRLDFFFQRLNDRTGGVMIVADRESFPEDDPVAWREREKKSLGRARYLFRVLLLIEFPVMYACVTFMFSGEAQSGIGILWLLYLIWGVTILMVAVKASTLISTERTRETLDALLSTAITNRELLNQKILGMRRLIMVMATPLFSIHLTLVLMYGNFASIISLAGMMEVGLLLLYFSAALFASWNLCHLVAWLCLLLGSRAKSQAKSVLLAVMVVGGWAVLSVTVLNTVDDERQVWRRRDSQNVDYLDVQLERTARRLFRIDGAVDAAQQFLSVASYERYRQFQTGSSYGQGNQLLLEILALALMCGWHWGMSRVARWFTLRRSAHLLDRAESENRSDGALYATRKWAGEAS